VPLSQEEAALLLSLSQPPDALPSRDDELDAHPCMLPLVRPFMTSHFTALG
jgi:hypothetical protein